MSIKELLNKFFKSKSKSRLLTLPTDLESIPMRDKLNVDKILVLDNYKNKYLETLSQKRFITSHDIVSQNFNNEMLMNFNLFGRVVINHNDIYNFDTMNDYEKDKLWIKQRITPTKMKLYIDRMEEMYNETHLRLIALKEIYQEIGITLSKSKRSAILNEIYNLTSSYIILKNNFLASLVETKTYKDELYVTPDITETAGKRLLSEYENELLNYVSLFIPDKIKQLESINDIEYRIAYIERELEIYTYNNLKIDDLNKELEELDKITKTKDNKFKILDKLHLLELKYKMLSNYGENELDLKPLYEVKFDVLTFDINDIDYNPFKEFILKKDLKHYEDIIFEKINTYITGKDSILNNQLDESNKGIINCFVNILKDNDKYDYQDILMDKVKLALLLSIPNIEKILEFFNNTIINKNKYNGYYDGNFNTIFNGINLDDKVPLSTLCRLQLMKEKNKGLFGYLSYFAKIYEYYANKQQIKDDNIYKVPEGIVEINCNVLGFDNNKGALEYLISKINGKTLIMPSSLKEIEESNVFERCSIPQIVLNEGLEYIYSELPFICNGTKSITIPSTLNTTFYRRYAVEMYCKSYDTFVFTNFEDSITLQSHDELSYIIDILCTNAMHDLTKKISEINMTQYTELIIKPRSIILVSKDGTKTKIEIDAIVTKEFLKDIKKVYYNTDFSYENKNISSYINARFKEKVKTEIEEKIANIVTNQRKSQNLKK